MKLNDKGAMRRLDRTLVALAHPARRAILNRLMRTEARVTDLAEPFAMSLNAVSKHIRVLERAGLVTRRRSWREHIVTFNPAPLDDVAAWVEQQRAFWKTRLSALDQLLQAQDAQAAQKMKPTQQRGNSK